MNLHAVLVGDNIPTSRSCVGTNDDAVFEDRATNRRSSFRRFRRRHRAIAHQKGVPSVKKNYRPTLY